MDINGNQARLKTYICVRFWLVGRIEGMKMKPSVLAFSLHNVDGKQEFLSGCEPLQ